MKQFRTMTQLSKEAKKVLLSIIDNYLKDQESTVVNANKPNSGIMPVHVEVVQTGLQHQSNKNCFVVSIAHYYEQNGDLMADPLMEFLVSDYRHIVGNKETKDNELLDLVGIWPTRFYQDGIFARDESIILFEDNKPSKFVTTMHQHCSFCTGWFKNIKWQQNIKIAINTTPSSWGKQSLPILTNQ
jgi:hypothetical protein